VAKIHQQIAQELGVREQQVEAAIALLDGGATVPFIARYRKELTGALDDAQLRTLEERLTYLRELEERRTVVLHSIREQGKLDALGRQHAPRPKPDGSKVVILDRENPPLGSDSVPDRD
jgi:protein Tex